MISDALQKWTVVIVICSHAVHPQMAMMPMGFGYGPMLMPGPMPIPVPIGIQMPQPESATTTTTTTSSVHEDDDRDNNNPQNPAVGIPMPMPHIVQIAIPSFVPENCRPDNKKNGNRKNCPPCPPCTCDPCTPSFFSFCSPCHQQCRCKNGKENPIPQEPQSPKPIPGPVYPMPIPMPGPPPVVIVPFPPQFGRPCQPPHDADCDPRPDKNHDSDCDSRPAKKHDSDCDSRPVTKSCSEESKSQSSCETGYKSRKDHRHKNKKKRDKKKKNYDIYRRNMGFMKRNRRNDGLVEPVLTYMSKNGDVVMKRRLNNNEAQILLGEDGTGEGEPFNQVRVMTGENPNYRRRVVMMPGRRTNRQRQKSSDSQHILMNGKKELVFKTPVNKKISNLSVTFQVTN